MLSLRQLSAKTGIPKSTIHDRKKAAEVRGRVKGREEVELENGVVLVASDMHYWPGEASVGHRAFVKFCKELRPNIVVLNGDVLDGCAISRHPPIGWNRIPSVKEELEVCQVRLGEIDKAASKAAKFWPLGNHDARFETRLAQVAPEFKDVHGISLSDHFPEWKGCWSLHINSNTVVKHRYKGGLHAPYNNTVSAGMSIITGHLHSQKVTPHTDYNGTRYGVDTGCLADPYADAFQDYLEDGPRNWRSGFCVLTFHNGILLPPELVTVMDDKTVYFRGALHEV
jgi:hypothetical protein